MKIILIIYFLTIPVVPITAQNEGKTPEEIHSNVDDDSSESLILWQKEINSGISAPLLSLGDKIFIPAADGKIYCFDLNGSLLWNYEAAGTIGNQLSIDNNVLIASTVEGDLFSIDAETGELLQVIGLGETITSQTLIIPILNRGEKSRGIIAGTGNGNLYCYDLFSFELIWENNSAGNAIGGKILAAKERLIFTSTDKQLYCIDGRTGVINWKWKISKPGKTAMNAGEPKTFDFATDGQKVFIFDPEEKVTAAIDLLLGTTIWQKKDFKGSNSLLISSDNKKLFLSGEAGNFYIAAPENGKQIREIKNNFDPGETYSEPAEWKGNILFGSSSGRIYLIDKNYNWKIVFSVAGASINSLKHIGKNIFAASSAEGRVIIFELNKSWI